MVVVVIHVVTDAHWRGKNPPTSRNKEIGIEVDVPPKVLGLITPAAQITIVTAQVPDQMPLRAPELFEAPSNLSAGVPSDMGMTGFEPSDSDQWRHVWMFEVRRAVTEIFEVGHHPSLIN